MTTGDTVRIRVVFKEPRMLFKSEKKEGLKRCWLLLKPQHKTIFDLSSHLHHTFRLHRTCPDGIILLMDGFVLPPFESTSILKDKDIVCVKRKRSISTVSKPAMLSPAPHGHGTIELPKLLAIEGFQEETGGHETVSEEDNNDQLEVEVYEEPKSDGNAISSKKRKASNKHKSPSKKKVKLSSTEKVAVIREHEEENGSFQGHTHHPSKLVKDNDKSSKLSPQSNKSSKLDSHKQSNEQSAPMHDKTRSIQSQDDDGVKKACSRSARRKKARRIWLREQLKKEKLHPSQVPEKDGKQLPIKDNKGIVSDGHQQSNEESEAEDDTVPMAITPKGIVSDVHQQPDDESEAEDDIVPVEIRPGHIRFEPLRKDQAPRPAPQNQNQFPMETFQWNGITSKKKGQKWGKERFSSHKKDDYEHYSLESPIVQNAENKHIPDAVDFDKLTPYTSLPKEGDVIAYRLIELSESWTPELSSYRVGKVSQYDAKSNRIWLELVSEYPFEFKKKIEEDASSVQFDPSPYGEDGSLEIDYLSLADVRMVDHGNLASATVVAACDASVDPSKATDGSIGEKLADDQTTVASCNPESTGHVPAKENGEVNVWDEINEALKAKKSKLSQEDGWRKEKSSGTGSWSHRAMRCSALGPTMAYLRSQNGI